MSIFNRSNEANLIVLSLVSLIFFLLSVSMTGSKIEDINDRNNDAIEANDSLSASNASNQVCIETVDDSTRGWNIVAGVSTITLSFCMAIWLFVLIPIAKKRTDEPFTIVYSFLIVPIFTTMLFVISIGVMNGFLDLADGELSCLNQIWYIIKFMHTNPVFWIFFVAYDIFLAILILVYRRPLFFFGLHSGGGH